MYISQGIAVKSVDRGSLSFLHPAWHKGASNRYLLVESMNKAGGREGASALLRDPPPPPALPIPSSRAQKLWLDNPRRPFIFVFFFEPMCIFQA